jgi:hypothetical protein
VLRDDFLQIVVSCNLICCSRACNFYMLTKYWTSIWTTLRYAADSPFPSSQFSIRFAASFFCCYKPGALLIGIRSNAPS